MFRRKSREYKGPFGERLAARCINSKRKWIKRFGFWLLGRYTQEGEAAIKVEVDLWDGISRYKDALAGDHLLEFLQLRASICGIKNTEKVLDYGTGQNKLSKIVFGNGDVVKINTDLQPAQTNMDNSGNCYYNRTK